jgi:glycosyltransferase involved in cell wall biosynthesis
LIVAGRPRYKASEDLALIDELRLRDRVEFLHYVPNDDLPAIYNLADCFVYPSLYESFGLAQLEAMACGCPVIGARAGAIPEVSGDAAFLFDPHSPEDLANAIAAVTGDAEVRQTFVSRGLARARQFTWERTAEQTLGVLKEVGA